MAATGFAAMTPASFAQTVVSGGANNASSGKTASVDQSCTQSFVDRGNPGNPSSGGQYLLAAGCATAVGNNASAQSAGVALGDRASAAQGGVALGTGARAVQGNSGVAIGPVALSSGNTSLAIGRQSAATGDYSMALGNVAYAKGESGIAMGHSALADGYRSIAIGASDSRAAGNDGVSNGANYNPATQTRASGTNSVSLGAGAVTSADDSVAIGSNSVGVANATGPAKFSGDAIASTGAISVGRAGSERQIRNVAGGTAGTDAVNVNQLTAVSDSAVKYDTNADGSINYNSVTLNPGGSPSKLGNVAAGDVSSTSTDAVNGSQLNQTNQTVNNLGDSTASAIGGGASYDPATGKVTNPTYNIAGGQQNNISDAINALNEGWNVTTSGNASGTAVTAIKPGATMTVDGGKNIALTQNGSTISIATSDAPTFTSVGIDNGGPVLSGSGLNMAGQKITNVAAGDVSSTSTDAVNGSQLNQTNQTVNNLGDSTASAIGGGASYDPATGKVTNPTYNIAGGQQNNVSDAINALNEGWNVTTSGNASGTAVTAIKPGSTMTIDGGKNIALTQNGSTISIATSDTPTFTSVGIDNGGPVLSGSGLNMAGQKITNVAAGDVSSTSTDAVNGSQLHQTNQTVNNLGDSTASAIGGGASYDPATGKVTNPTYNIAGGQQNNVSDAINALNEGWNVTTSGNASGTSVTAIKPGSTMTIDGGKNIALTQNGSTISIATSDTPTFTSVGIDNGGPVLSGSGLNMAGQKITNVAAGDVSSTSTDAVSGSQLNDTNEKVQQVSDQAVKYDTNPDGTINYNSVTMNPGGSPTKITNVAAGDVSADSTDAVNGSQLYETNQNVTKLGDTLNNIAGDTSQSYTDANGVGIRYARTNEAGLPQTDAFAQAPGSTAVGYAATASADNALALGRETTASHAGSVALGANAVADGATLGNAAYNPGKGTIAGTNPVGEVSIGGSGAERRITNVAAGAEDTDAVNVSQLKALQSSVGDVSDRAVKYDGNPGDPKTQISLEGPASTDGGKTGGTKITNVAQGDVSENSTDAVNGSQLHQTNQTVNNLGDSTASAIGGGASYDPGTGKVTNPTYNIAGGQQNNISDAINALNAGWNVTTSGNASGMAVTAIKPGSTMTLDGGKNVALTQNGSTISIATSDTPTFTSVGIDNGGPTLSGSGLDMAGQKIRNVAPGDVSAGSTDAVNGSQLNDTNQNVTKLGDTITNIAGDTSQSYTDQNGTGIRYARTNEAGLAQTDAFAQAPGSTAVGYAATASADDALALGRQTTASHAGSVALGANAVANGSTLGNAAYNPGTGTLAGTNPIGEVSIGSSGAERRITNVAAGSADTDAVNVSQLKSVATSVGNVSDRAVKYDGKPGDPKTQITLEGPASTDGGKTGGTKLTNVAQGDVSANSTDAVNGSQLNETNGNVTKLGDTLTNIAGDTSQSYTDQNGTGIRYARTNEAGLAQTDAFAQAPGSTAVGYAATASANDALALGRQTTASHAGSVALGANAIADGSTLGNAAYNPGTGTLAGTNPIGEVSIGSSGAERRITNVAAGSADTDAVNVSQLKSLETSVGDLGAGVVKYDRNPDGTIDYTHVTMNPGGAPTAISNVAAGELSATSTDAVNGSQLYETNRNVTRLGDQIDTIANGGGIKYFHANGGGATPLPDSQANGAGSTAMGPAAQANGANAVAVGNGAVANKDGDVALGAGSAADRGAEQYTGKYSGAQNSTAGTVSVGAPGAERTISNVADGREATDAVNVRQLDGAVKEAKDYTDQQVQKVAGDVVNVGDDVKNLGDRMTNVEGDVTSIRNGSGGMFQVSQDGTPVAPAASGSNAVAGGAGAVASGANSTAIGNQASATGGNSTAIGNGAKASGSNSVALGAGSDGSRDNAVSMGAAGRERQVVNVAPGTAGTDAVNVDQLHAMERGLGNQIAGVRNDMQSMDHRLTAGVAAAMAMAGLPQAYAPGKSMVALGGGTWRGESGVALGLSTVSDNGNWVLKGSASSTSRGDVGASVGVGYQW
ncbi:YadA-like family protein [Burkholderia pyrrocinia]